MSNVLNYTAILITIIIGIISITNGTFSLFVISLVVGAILWTISIEEGKKW